MFGRDPWGGPLEISNADSATDDDRSRDLDRGALMRQLDETQQSWLLAGPGDQAGKKKKKYVDLGCMVLDRKIFMWTVGTILGVGLFIGFVMMIVKLVPHKRPPPPPPDQYTQALHKALMFFNAQRCEFFHSFPPSVSISVCIRRRGGRRFQNSDPVLHGNVVRKRRALAAVSPLSRSGLCCLTLFLHLACLCC
jgi:hypothetical protein